MKKVLLVITMVLCILGFAAATGQQDNGKIRVGASVLTSSHPFYQAIKVALEEEAAAQDVDLTVTVADQDLNRQLSSIEDFINKNVDVIIITPVDSDGVKGAVLKAQSAGIPVITVDIKANGVDVHSHIATDNYTGGMLAGQAMAQYLNFEGKVALITYPEVQSVRDRIDGFKEQVAQYKGIEIVAELPGRTREEAKIATEDMMTANPGIKGIFGFGDDMAIAATTVVKERKSSAIVIGFDGMEEGRNTVDADNAFKAVVMQAPGRMGSTAIDLAVKIAKGEKVEKDIPIVPGLYIYGAGEVPVKSDLSFDIK
ncbi:sugar ABC transporter substrate-binding protein [Oceanispirochaeta crateris]|uniref:Sugar ABC transporter substrate-binding protein n=1 Tax=Oceanispirochaeta crateris TaxID=2518645 RepID=A0A5C1QTB1_9SPIO|nr:substrate-binding domain-containing protein [Oceanispirochaeta crateris]QEN09806.1 sugar ABC transporter substrate-binding protein [Oceanispirochaeta crateris]